MEKPLRTDAAFPKGAAGDALFNDALKAWNDANPSSNPSTGGGGTQPLVRYTAPKPVKLEGTVTKVGNSFESRFNKGSFSRTINMSGGQSFNIAESVFKNNEKYLALGLEVIVMAEQRQKGVTGYIDTAGAEQAHKGDGLGFTSVALSEQQAIAAAKEDANMSPRQRLEATISAITKAEVADKDAIATSLQRFVASK